MNEQLVPYEVWSRAFSDACAPTPKLADMIAAVQDAARRIEDSACTAAHFYDGGVLNAEEMRTVACLCSTADLLTRISDNVRGWPDRVKDIIRNKPEYRPPNKGA